MKNSKLRRILLTLACAVLLVSLSVGATLAYLQDATEVVTNTFSVGQVNIELDELDVDIYGDPEQVPVLNEDGTPKLDAEGKPVTKDTTERVTANQYKLIPNHNYMKDPTVHVIEGSEVCWLFVEVVNEISAIEADTTIAAQMTTNGWSLVAGTNNIYAYRTTVDAREAAQDVVVFEEFTLTTDADVSAYANAVITVKAYAVQADGFDTAAAAWATTYGAN